MAESGGGYLDRLRSEWSDSTKREMGPLPDDDEARAVREKRVTEGQKRNNEALERMIAEREAQRNTSAASDTQRK